MLDTVIKTEKEDVPIYDDVQDYKPRYSTVLYGSHCTVYVYVKCT